MAQMRAAGVANSFHPYHAIAVVCVVGDGVFLDWLREGRPAGAGLEFFRSVEQKSAAADEE